MSSLFTAIAIVPWLSDRLYEKLYADILEASFFLNISILTSATYHVQTVNGNQSTLTDIAVGIVFVEFVGIVVFHVCLRFKVTEFFLKLRRVKVTLKKPETDQPAPRGVNTVEMSEQATNTIVELREPLLEDT